MTPRRPLDPYWMLLPTAVFLAVFFFYPLVFAVWTSFQDWDLLTPPVWVGGANYAALLESGGLARIAGTTLLFSAVVVVGSVASGLGLALLLHRPGRLAALVRGAIFSAYVVSWVAVALIWLFILDPGAGVVSRSLAAVGLRSPDWLGDPVIAPYTLAAVTVWKVAGYAMVLFLSGLEGVPGDLREAAALDGASRLDVFRHVVWPLLRPTAAFVVTTSLILSFQAFDVVRVMTQGGPVRSTTVFSYAIYEQIFLDLRVGRASALVVCLFVLLLGLTGLQLAAFRRKGAV